MKIALFLALSAAVLHAQPKFEAASIKPNNSGRAGGGINLQPARIKVVNSSVKFCVQMAWHVQSFQVSAGPAWIDSEKYDIQALAAAPFQKDGFRPMLQSLLADRFGLVIHLETQERQGYALVPAKNGPKLSPPLDDPSSIFSSAPNGDETFKAPSASTASLAEALSFRLGAPIVDRTGVEGHFNVSLEYAPERPITSKSGISEPPGAADSAPGPSLFTALQETLGLKLESRKVPVDVVVIDQVRRPSDN